MLIRHTYASIRAVLLLNGVRLFPVKSFEVPKD